MLLLLLYVVLYISITSGFKSKYESTEKLSLRLRLAEENFIVVEKVINEDEKSSDESLTDVERLQEDYCCIFSHGQSCILSCEILHYEIVLLRFYE